MNILLTKEHYMILYTILVNLYGIWLISIDKHRASHHKWRVKETHIFSTAVLGGALGIMVAMRMFRHKTKHKSFTIGIPVIFVINIIIVLALVYWIYI